MINATRFRENVTSYLDARTSDSRYASFDYCFNYFQRFRGGKSRALAERKNLQLSCLHLGFYLASWGMYRGSTSLLKKSMMYLVPVIEAIVRIEPAVWDIDVHCYTEQNIRKLLDVSNALRRVYNPEMSDALVTKIMLGVFGNVPAFDTNFKAGMSVSKFGPKALRSIRAFYEDNARLIGRYRRSTLHFSAQKLAARRYTRAKVIDMAFYIEGDAKRSRSRSKQQRRGERHA